MFLLYDLVCSMVDSTAAWLGLRTANALSCAACSTVGIAALGCGRPGVAVVAFTLATIDAWTLKRGGYSDERS